MIRVLQVVSGLNYGGIELFLKNTIEHMPLEDVKMSILVTSPDRGALEDFFESNCDVYHLRDCSTRRVRTRERIDFFKKHKNEFDIVHIHTVLTTCYSIAKIAKKYQNCKVIIHSHIAADYSFATKIKNDLARSRMNKYADVRLACSRNSAEFLFGKKYGKNAVVIKNAVDCDKFAYSETTRAEVRKELDISDDTFVLGNVGRMSVQKNHLFLLDIFNEFRKMQSDSKLLIVGDGELRAKIETKITALGLNDSVILTGARGDIERLLNAMDCFVMPSLFEGLAISAVEAQANGLKCFLSDTITKDIDIDGDCDFISIDLHANLWANIIKKSDNTRKDKKSSILKCGYEISSSAANLLGIYQKCYKEV